MANRHAAATSGGGCASFASESTMAARKERWCSRKEVTWPPGTHLHVGTPCQDTQI